jgi:hypothetical protein
MLLSLTRPLLSPRRCATACSQTWNGLVVTTQWLALPQMAAATSASCCWRGQGVLNMRWWSASALPAAKQGLSWPLPSCVTVLPRRLASCLGEPTAEEVPHLLVQATFAWCDTKSSLQRHLRPLLYLRPPSSGQQQP